ncbi:MAG: DUF192 domain-containing protein [Candidatus Wolfebacteria bacterium]|nr:DUF192 domain-containing protein [Candidatus Wolfebacteria bacterium]
MEVNYREVTIGGQLFRLEMKFPIDIVWVAGNKIIRISENVKAGFYFRRPDRKIGAVLEIRAGRAKEIGLSAGDEISC